MWHQKNNDNKIKKLTKFLAEMVPYASTLSRLNRDASQAGPSRGVASVCSVTAWSEAGDGPFWRLPIYFQKFNFLSDSDKNGT